jgi:diguanylate cyclase (GGDEF)-like protein/PAS domain S-box-containing protein
MTGYSLGDVLGLSPRFLQGPRTDRAMLAEMMETLRAGRPAQARVVNYASSGMPFWIEMRISPLRDQDGRVTHFVAVERDVTHDMRRFDELEVLAERDPLTSIANRRGLERFAERVLAQADGWLCIAYIDIDRFKQVNDTLGHAAGDALLLGVADLLAENMRRADFVGRLGGDEFLVCMPGIRPAEALSVAERLHRTILNTEFATPAGPVRTDCSIGVAMMRADDISIDGAIARADSALYQAKAAGRGRVVMEPSPALPAAATSPSRVP